MCTAINANSLGIMPVADITEGVDEVSLGQEESIKVDTGAEVTALSENTWRSVPGTAPLQPTKKSLCGGNGKLLSMMGRTELLLKHNKELPMTHKSGLTHHAVKFLDMLLNKQVHPDLIRLRYLWELGLCG